MLPGASSGRKAVIMKRFALLPVIALIVSAAAWIGCGRTSTGHTPDASPSGTFKIALTNTRQLDMVFMIDNSGMAPKVEKMSAQFPKMIAALKDPSDGTLPDLRIALIDSDLGTGGGWGNYCGPSGSNGNSVYGDQGKFLMPNRQACGVTDPEALYLETQGNTGLNFISDINTVFACLAGGFGTSGCGYEHQLQAFEFALVAGGLGNDRQHAMIRPNALLALVFITDEDDCSAAQSDRMFVIQPDLAGESASLRCATRAHQCNGVNLTTAPPGYPTTAAFTAPLAACAARTDACPIGTDTLGPTACSPLKDTKDLANEIKGLKADPDNQVVVAGIFGWPLSDADLATATYKIAPVPNPNTADTEHPTVFDLWPACYEPNHNPASSTGFDGSAWGWAAMPGLRLSAFVDEFGPNGLKFSICETDFTSTMGQIGAKLAKQVSPRCLSPRFATYKSCTAHIAVPNAEGGFTVQADAIPSCEASPSTADCYTLVPDAPPCATGEFLVQTPSTPALPSGSVLEFTCR